MVSQKLQHLGYGKACELYQTLWSAGAYTASDNALRGRGYGQASHPYIYRYFTGISCFHISFIAHVTHNKVVVTCFFIRAGT